MRLFPQQFLVRKFSSQLGLTVRGVAFLGGMGGLAGCGGGVIATPADITGSALVGSVHGGQQPVTSSHIALYATTSAGYQGTPNLLASTTTDGNGNWTISTAYTCPAGQQAYVVASGGNPGIMGTVDNSAIFLVAALGPCAGVSSSTFVNINEVTTVAAAYALAGFAPTGGAGFAEGNITAGFTTSSTNTQGLKDAFANTANLASSSAGTALAVPSSTTFGVAPQAMMNTLANILQDCVNSTGPSSTACSNLFTAAKPPTTSGVSAPANVLQAVLDIAAYPGNNPAGLFALESAQAAFAPVVSTQPSDFTLAISFNGGQIAAAQGLTIDDTDNVWISGSTYASLIQLSAQGVPVSPVGATPTTQAGWIPAVVSSSHLIRNLSFDTTGNLWLPDSTTSQIYQYLPAGTSAGTLTPYAYTSANANLGSAYDLGLDGSGNIWFGSYKKNACANSVGALCAYVELQKSGATYTPIASFNSNTYTLTNSSKTMAVDANPSSPGYGNVWIAPNSASSVQIFQSPYTSQPLLASLSSTAYSPQCMAVDRSGNDWIATFSGGNLFQVSPNGTLLNTITNTTALNEPNSAAIDGNGNLFFANYGASTLAEYSPAYNSGAGAFLSLGTGFNPGATYNTSSSKYTGGLLNSPVQVAVDRSGALWLLNQGVGTMVQVLGLAAPARPVLAYGHYGQTP